MSNYNYGLEPGIQQNGSSRLRFVLIFLLVSALIAALIWWFWPDKKKDENDNVFYYFYIRELRDLFWILLEDYSSMK